MIIFTDCYKTMHLDTWGLALIFPWSKQKQCLVHPIPYLRVHWPLNLLPLMITLPCSLSLPKNRICDWICENWAYRKFNLLLRYMNTLSNFSDIIRQFWVIANPVTICMNSLSPSWCFSASRKVNGCACFMMLTNYLCCLLPFILASTSPTWPIILVYHPLLTFSAITLAHL